MEDVRASYSTRIRSSRKDLAEILIRFEDYEQLSIDSVIATEALLNRISVAPGTTFDMLVHPNSSTILALSIDGEEIISFDAAMERLRKETTAFFWMGVCLYAAAAFGAYVVILRLKLRRY